MQFRYHTAIETYFVFDSSGANPATLRADGRYGCANDSRCSYRDAAATAGSTGAAEPCGMSFVNAMRYDRA